MTDEGPDGIPVRDSVASSEASAYRFELMNWAYDVMRSGGVVVLEPPSPLEVGTFTHGLPNRDLGGFDCNTSPYLDDGVRDYVAGQGYVSGDAMVVKHEGLPGMASKCWMDVYDCPFPAHENACTDCTFGIYLPCNQEQMEHSDLGLCQGHLDQMKG